MASTSATALLLLVVCCCLLPGGWARLWGFSPACCGSAPGEVPAAKTSEFYAGGIRRRLMGDREGSKPPSPRGNPPKQRIPPRGASIVRSPPAPPPPPSPSAHPPPPPPGFE